MTDADRKRLTEYLGEYWHEPVGIDTIGMICSCGLRSYNAAHEKKYNRTFTTSQDMVDLVKKMVEREEFEGIAIRLTQCGKDVRRSGRLGRFVDHLRGSRWLRLGGSLTFRSDISRIPV